MLFSGLAQLHLDNPQKAAEVWGRLQQETTDPKLAQDVGRMRTILLREAAERAAKQALAQERQLQAQRTDPRTVAISTFQNSGTAEFATLGKALAAMLIDNLSALPNVRVLEREQVQALEEEARLAASGLTEKTTAVRTGKLLRAGRVSAGSHTDWTASPTHLALSALLIDVDAGTTVAEGKSEAFATEFYQLVPQVATTFSGALGQPAAQLPPAIQERLQKPHTRSLPAALAFGKALDALDHHDAQAALEACKLAQKEDPNFELAKKKCAFIPFGWLSIDGVIAAMEPVGGTAVASSSLLPAAIGVAVLGGAIAGGVLAYPGGAGESHGGGSTGAGAVGSPPDLSGVSDQSVAGGQTATIDMQCVDPRRHRDDDHEPASRSGWNVRGVERQSVDRALPAEHHCQPGGNQLPGELHLHRWRPTTVIDAA